jgi:hypothetical protein
MPPRVAAINIATRFLSSVPNEWKVLIKTSGGKHGFIHVTCARISSRNVIAAT